MKIATKQVPVDAALIASLNSASVMIHEKSRFKGCRRHLRHHRARDGRYYVLVGARGHDRIYLAPIAEQLFLDGELITVQFWFEGQDPVTQSAEWEAKNKDLMDRVRADWPDTVPAQDVI